MERGTLTVPGGEEGNIPESWAMDLTRSYNDLKEEYTRRRERGSAGFKKTMTTRCRSVEDRMRAMENNLLIAGD